MARPLTRAAAAAAGAIATATAFAVGIGAAGSAASAVVERRRNRVHQRGPYRASPRAVELHRSLIVVDLHVDSLLWGRDLLHRAGYGHVDVPRLVEGAWRSSDWPPRPRSRAASTSNATTTRPTT